MWRTNALSAYVGLKLQTLIWTTQSHLIFPIHFSETKVSLCLMGALEFKLGLGVGLGSRLGLGLGLQLEL